MLIQVIISSTREGRFSEKVAPWVVQHLRERGDLDVETVDLRDYPMPFFEGAPPARAPRSYPNPQVARFGQTIDRADGYVFLIAEYNHSFPAVLKNAFEWTSVEWRRKPAGFVGWGGVGGARAIEALRPIVGEYEMVPLRPAVHILPDVMGAVMQSNGDIAAFEPLKPKLKLLSDDLTWWARALRTARDADPE